MSFQENLQRFKRFLDIVKQKTDIKSRVALLLNPDKPQSSTRLTASQVDFVALSYFSAKKFDIFEPLKEFAEEFCLSAISLKGLGREEAIQLVSALNDQKLLSRMGFIPQGVKDDGAE